jgi:hypothetical protein
MLLIPGHKITPQMLRYSVINGGPPACGALLLLGFVRLLRLRLGFLFSPAAYRPDMSIARDQTPRVRA